MLYLKVIAMFGAGVQTVPEAERFQIRFVEKLKARLSGGSRTMSNR